MKHELKQQIPDEISDMLTLRVDHNLEPSDHGMWIASVSVFKAIRRVLDRESASQKRHDDNLDALEAKLRRISDWCDAYPLEVFPAPNLEADRKLLGDSEFTRLNAAAMRHVVEGIALIAKEPANVAKETQE